MANPERVQLNIRVQRDLRERLAELAEKRGGMTLNELALMLLERGAEELEGST